jgi:RNA polymerase sigma-70 factor (ECF subfamily)
MRSVVPISPPDSRERQLVDRLRRRDESAVSDLASLYGTKIFQLAFRYVKNREDAEEIVQDVLMKVFCKIDAFRGDSALSSWIYRITFNTSMSRLRTTKAVRAFETEDVPVATDAGPALRPEPPDWSNMADEQILRREMRSRLAEAVVKLPAIYRAPVILRDFQGLSTEEASVALRVKDQTLKSRLHRGRSILRRQLEDFASGLTMHRAALQSAVAR